jgi:hypothetical protein
LIFKIFEISEPMPKPERLHSEPKPEAPKLREYPKRYMKRSSSL